MKQMNIKLTVSKALKEHIPGFENEHEVGILSDWKPRLLRRRWLDDFDYVRFLQAINKVVSNNISDSQAESNTVNDYILVKADYKLYKINYTDLLYIEGQHEYVTFHTTTKRITALYSLKNLEDILPKDKFVRTHKSFIVSIKNIEDIDKLNVTVAGNKIPVGASYRDALIERLS